MNSLNLLLKELLHRPVSFALGVAGVAVAAACCVVGPILLDAYRRDTDRRISELQEKTDEELRKLEDETRKLMLTMGFNLLIVPADTNMADFWAQDFAAQDMPQEYVDRLANSQELSLVTHLVATLQQRVDFDGRKVLLVGYLPETPKAHEKSKKPMGYQIEPGTALLGHELGRGRAVGDTIEALGRSLKVAKILPEKGSKEDITLAVHLGDAQAMLDRPGRVNQILAIGCQCEGERLPKIRAQLAGVLPETKITEFESIAAARAEQRDLVSAEHAQRVEALAAHRAGQESRLASLSGVVTPLAVLAAAAWIGLMTLLNVRERRHEIGLFRALGQGSGRIATLFLGKAVFVGAIGGLMGLVAGVWIARLVLGSVLGIDAGQLNSPGGLLAAVGLGAPAIAALAAYLPTLAAILQSPAVVLRES